MLNWNYRYLIVLLFCLLPSLACAGYVINSFGTFGGGGGGGGDTYIGWANSGGTPTGSPSVTVGDSDLLLTEQWTATENGTANTVEVYTTSHPATMDYEAICVYRDITGTITLVGQGALTSPSASAEWSGKITLVAEGGQTLAFVTNDVLYFGYGASSTSGSSSNMGRELTGGVGQWGEFTDKSSLPATVTSWTTSAGRELGLILGYTP